MNPKVLMVVGLPGSGKTHYVLNLLKTSHQGYLMFDDINDTHQFIDGLSKNKNCIVVDPHFCADKPRELAHRIAKFYLAEVEWIFFENDPEQCLKNVLVRNDGRLVQGFIKQYSKKYTIPKDAKIIKVFKLGE